MTQKRIYSNFTAGTLGILFAAALLTVSAEAGHAFPKDFQGFSGFGGDETLDRSGNRARMKRIPVILLHGNGGTAVHNQWGMTRMRDMLYDAGYNPSEIWAVSYLNGGVELTGVHKNRIDAVRDFIEAVKRYMGVPKVDIVAHSLGATLARAYMGGFQRSGKFDPMARKFDSVSTLVSLSGAHDGLGPNSVDEFKTDSEFLKGLNSVGAVSDQSPYGPASEHAQQGEFKGVSLLDNDQVTWVGFWAAGDFVDNQRANTGALRGADINKAFDLGAGLGGHEKIIKDPAVVSGFLPYLNRKRAANAVELLSEKTATANRDVSEKLEKSLSSLSKLLNSGWN